MVEIQLYRATIEDCEKIYLWRNASEVRESSISSKEIKLQEHKLWFEKTLFRHDRILLLAKLSTQEDLGVLRFDLTGEVADVSIYLTTAFIGKGYGAMLLTSGERWIKENFPELKTLQAKILIVNERSKKTFMKAGFSPKIEIFTKEIVHASGGQ